MLSISEYGFTATILLWLVCTSVFATDYPELAFRLESEKEALIPGEPASISVKVTNIGTKDAPRWSTIAPGVHEEYRFRMLDPEGNELSKPVAEIYPEMALKNPIRPSKTATYENIHFLSYFHETKQEWLDSPGDYSVWVEYIPEIHERGDAPVVAKSNVLEFHVESLNILVEKVVKKKFTDIGYSKPREAEALFKVFIHRGEKSDRIYWTQYKDAKWPNYLVSDRVIPDMFDISVDGYGNTHLWYRTVDGDFHHFIRRNSTRLPPEKRHISNLRLKETEWKTLDVAEGQRPRFKLVDDRVEIEYVPAPPEDTDGEEPRLHPPVRVPPPEPPVSEKPAPDKTDWEPDASHWIIIAVIALTVTIVAAVLMKKKK